TASQTINLGKAQRLLPWHPTTAQEYHGNRDIRSYTDHAPMNGRANAIKANSPGMEEHQRGDLTCLKNCCLLYCWHVQPRYSRRMRNRSRWAFSLPLAVLPQQTARVPSIASNWLHRPLTTPAACWIAPCNWL